jgi:hypothetical protein
MVSFSYKRKRCIWKKSMCMLKNTNTGEILLAIKEKEELIREYF